MKNWRSILKSSEQVNQFLADPYVLHHLQRLTGSPKKLPSDSIRFLRGKGIVKKSSLEWTLLGEILYNRYRVKKEASHAQKTTQSQLNQSRAD